jgi:hypothetical protein
MDAPTTQPTSLGIVSQPRLRLSRADEVRSSESLGVATETLLEEARQLLVSLKVDRSRVEARLAEFGREDPIEVVKGSSALDEAIEKCQIAIERLDQLAGANRNG